jgi:hypothetical protein
MTKKILIGFLATIGAIALLGMCGFILLRELAPTFATPEVTFSFPSQNGKYNAVILGFAGGGGLSPYCCDKVLVIPSSVDWREAYRTPNKYKSGEGRYEIFTKQCDSFRDQTGSTKPMNWITDNELQITFSINSSAIFTEDVHLRKLDDSKQVNVKYIVEYNPIPVQHP